ncbi:hypothetical protein DICVIV_14040 [Dictyocaulus viviparus]|uniref:Uncharacterized protein n=1 Tax=Dictyocaulus viviparus TaxID=29172 RepID=A0A0D8XC42_DICVI|nr:hypothetical protein DICVIV_14040 [Dictyocaulus viviparus]
MMKMVYCQVVGGSVVMTCTPTAADCNLPADLKPIPPKHLSITGSVRTTNVIMANWSREMWKIVLGRVVRSLKSGPLASSFYAASVTVN